jgi:hypothetical protein
VQSFFDGFLFSNNLEMCVGRLVDLLGVAVDSTGEKCLHFWRYVMAYIDDEASRQALIKAYSSNVFVSLEDNTQYQI